MWIMICCWECLLVQNLAEHFKSCMGAQRRPWANVILSDKKNHLFSRATDILWDNYFGMQIFCGCLLPIIMLFIYLFILLQSVNPDFEFVFYNWPALKKRSDLIFQSFLPWWLLNYLFFCSCNSHWNLRCMPNSHLHLVTWNLFYP